ncbi:MAG: MFS transporter [Veillonella sp.]|uniref:MFS transporter n=1 Tax=Veillonella sp. TaxID=1926307 RepID=UPI0025D3C030|nr:MFS transporter [Veillonella sp.]MBS4912593.1 MFS transporter [Veillonella sp.]
MKLQVNSLKKSWFLLFLIFVAWGFGYVDRQAINIAAVFLREELSLTTGQMGAVMSSFFLMYSLMTLSGSYLISRFGTRKSLLSIVFLWAVFSSMTGMTSTFLMLVGVRFLLGFSQGGFASITSVAIAELFPPEIRGRAKAFQVSAGSMGIAFGTFFCALSTAWFGWRAMFFFFGIIGLIITLLLAKFYHPKPTEKGAKQESQVSLLHMMRNPFILKLAFVQFGLGVFIWGLNAWLPSYWLEVKGLDMIHMGALSTVPWIVSFILMNFSSYLLETRFQKSQKLMLSLSLFLGAVLMYAMLRVDSIFAGFTLLTIVTVLMSIASATVYMMPMQRMATNEVGTATGVIIFGQQLAGIIAPVVMGYLISLFAGSYDAVFGFVILVIILSTITALTIRDKKEIHP